MMTQTDKNKYGAIERYIRQLDTNGQKVALITAVTELIYALDAATIRANDAAEREGRIEHDCGWRSVNTDPPPLYVPIEILCTDGVRLDDGFVLPGNDGEPVGVRSAIKWRKGDYKYRPAD